MAFDRKLLPDMLNVNTEAMLEKPSDNFRISPEITSDEVIAIIANDFPHWKLACDRAGEEPVIIEQRELGRSLQAIFFLHIAFRYAGIVGKTVMIRPWSLE
ncbi:MAG: hypothetical protein WBE76_00975 [Terracidiphilus sp.]